MPRAIPTTFDPLWAFVVPWLLFLAAAWIARRHGATILRATERVANHRTAPLVAGALSALATVTVWSSLQEPGVVHDEQAYLFQARVFASFRWTGETPPLSEFFAQPHVLVEPRLAAKYPPGHSIALVPGTWLGLAGLMPVVMAGICGGLVYSIARTIRDASFSLLTWGLWTTAPVVLGWQASYMSQNTATLLWLASIWALLRWRRDGRAIDLTIVAACVGSMYLTRPLTAIGLAAPMAGYVLGTLRRRAAWNQLGPVAVVGIAVAIVNLVWHERTMGEWFTSPYAEYSRQYFPFVRPGFGVDPTLPTKVVPPEIAWIGDAFRHLHAGHLPAALPAILVERLLALGVILTDSRIWLAVPFVIGLAASRGVLLFGLASVAFEILAYLVYPHPSLWVVYYFETFPVFFAVSAHGLGVIGRTVLGLDSVRVAASQTLTFVLLTPLLLTNVLNARTEKDRWSEFHRRAAAVLATLPATPAVVFVNGPHPMAHDRSLIENTPDYRSAHLWLVYDRGPENERLLSLTDRAAYRLSTDDWTLRRLR